MEWLMDQDRHVADSEFMDDYRIWMETMNIVPNGINDLNYTYICEMDL